MQNQPLLTRFPSTIFATAKRRLQAVVRRARQQTVRQSLCGYALLFEALLPSAFLEQIDPTSRQRQFGHIPVFWAWLAQILEANASCSKALGLLQSWYRASGLPVPTGDTSGYCRARCRVSSDFLEAIFVKVNGSLRVAIRPMDLWKGHQLKAIDGSSVQLLDTADNQEAYPQPSSQKPGCGFPVMGIVGVLNLSHGGWEGFETCPQREHDARVAPRLLKNVKVDDIILADRAFCSYELIARLTAKGAHAVMRLHQARHRKLDWRRGKKLSPIERLVNWKKPPSQPGASALSAEQWDALPDEMTVRYIKLGYEDRAGEKRSLVIVTTLLDDEQYEATEISSLYARRWEIELKLRDVKTTLGMERFAVRTPAMAHKTLWMMMIAFNLTRSLMKQGAIRAGSLLEEMSFKAVLDQITATQDTLLLHRGKPRRLAACCENIIEICATKTVTIRLFRQEPRAIKQRPKNFQYLTAPRNLFRETPHRGHPTKAA